MRDNLELAAASYHNPEKIIHSYPKKKVGWVIYHVSDITSCSYDITELKTILEGGYDLNRKTPLLI